MDQAAGIQMSESFEFVQMIFKSHPSSPWFSAAFFGLGTKVKTITSKEKDELVAKQDWKIGKPQQLGIYVDFVEFVHIFTCDNKIR